MEEQKVFFDQGDIRLEGLFGAWVNSNVLIRNHINHLLPAVLVSPPIKLFHFDFPALRRRIGLILSGESDQFCPPERIKTVADKLSCRLEIVPDADHFFIAKQGVLAGHLRSYFAQAFSGNKFL